MIQARFRRRSWALLTAGLLTLAVGVTAGGVASAQTKSLTVGSKDFAGAQAISQAYGQALENKGYDITLQGEPRRHRDRLQGARERRPRRLRRLPGHPAHVPRRHADRRLGRDTTRRCRPSSPGTDITVSKPAPAVDVNGFYVTKDTAKKYKLKKVSDLKKVAPEAHLRRTARVRGRVRSASATRRSELYGLKFSEVKKLDAGGPITVQALEDGDIDVALLFTGSSVIPKDAVLLKDDKGLQPADNPVFLISKDKAHAGDHEDPQRGVGEAHHRGVQQDVARHQREQGRPGRRGRRLPEEERPRLDAVATRRRDAGLLDYVFSRLAITLIVVARITAPNRNEMSACRSTWWRISRRVMSVSDTWNVIPTVNAVYAKST